MTASELAQIKQGARATWAAGDYPAIARNDLWEVGERIVERTGVRAGEDVLDVACGNGNAAIRAAQRGARAVGLDITPELLAAGRDDAAAAGVELEWVEGDAEALPFEDESFDVVVSTFGCMFAPRHAVAARELARVLRPGGRLGVTAWTPEGAVGSFFAVVAGHLPPAPAIAEPPPLWGSEDHVRGLFAGTGVELEFRREQLEIRFQSADRGVDYYVGKFGPLIRAREATEATGTWPALYADLVAHFEATTTETADGVLVERREYLVTLGRKR